MMEQQFFLTRIVFNINSTNYIMLLLINYEIIFYIKFFIRFYGDPKKLLS